MNTLSTNIKLLTVWAACFGVSHFAPAPLQANPQDDSNRQSAPKNAPAAAGATTDGQWLKHAPNESNAEIMMPAKPQMSQRTFRPVADQPFIKVKTWRCTANGGQVVFTMSYHDLHQSPKSRDEIRQTLDGAVKGTLALLLGKLESSENIKLRDYLGRKFTYSFSFADQALHADAEVYLIGKRQYMLNTIFKSTGYDPTISQKYFETFNPFDPQTELTSNDAQGADTNQETPVIGGVEGFELPPGAEPVELK